MELIIDCLKAFCVGGLLCVIAQILIDKTKLTPARILVLYSVLGVILTALKIYQPLVDFAECGATTLLTGFGYLLATGVEKAVDEKGLIGCLTGGLTNTSAGIMTALFSGLIASLLCKSKPK